MIPERARSDRLLLALSATFFAASGLANTTIDSSAQSLVAVALTVGGVFGLALYARGVTRKALARLSLALWIAFLAVAVAHFFGLGYVGAVAPGPSGAIVVALNALTWTTLLGAVTSTAFLGFREYGSAPSADRAEDRILEQEYDL